MQISHDFSELWVLAAGLGAVRQPFTLSRTSVIPAIEAELIRGREVKLNDLEIISGLLAFEGRQILLYIPDQGTRFKEVIKGNRDAGTKFHVAHCNTLESMKNSGKFQRYIATIDISGTFLLSGTNMSKKEITQKGELYVCQHCLNMLNYKQAKVKRNAWALRQNFDLNEFFETFSSCFRYLPKRTKVEPGSAVYSADWREISNELRDAADWTCEVCKINLANSRYLLHVHHIDGVKSNNIRSNLSVLCKACHRMAPYHDHMYVPRNEMKVINQMRRDAGLFEGSWDSVMRFSDPAIHGPLGIARDQGWDIPEIEYVISNFELPLEAAWPTYQIGISLEKSLKNVEGWRVVDPHGFITAMVSD